MRVELHCDWIEQFIENSAMEKSGGSLHSINGHMNLHHSFLAKNRALKGGGGISQIGGSIRLTNVAFDGNQVPLNEGGDQINILRVHDWDAKDTSYLPWNSHSVFTVGSDPLNCAQFHCAPGFGCSIEQYSRVCTVCPHGTASVQGESCKACAPGFEPANRSSACRRCEDGSFSKHGTACVRCPAKLISNNETKVS